MGLGIFLTSLEFLHDFYTITYEILCPLPSFFGSPVKTGLTKSAAVG